MKQITCLLSAAILLLALGLQAQPAPVRTPENDGQDRLARLEQRLNQLAERQEQVMRRLETQAQPPAQPGQPNLQTLPPRFREQLHQELAPAAAPVHPARAEVAKRIHDFIGFLFFIGMIINILLAIWIYTDIRKRGEGAGIFIALALLAGPPSALIYALTRIGDRKA